MAMGPSNWGASREVVRMAVGPSAPPMMPMEAASAAVKPSRVATKKAKNTPIWAAAPSNRLLGLDSRGPKSVMAPTPIKIRQGYTPALTPM